MPAKPEPCPVPELSESFQKALVTGRFAFGMGTWILLTPNGAST